MRACVHISFMLILTALAIVQIDEANRRTEAVRAMLGVAMQRWGACHRVVEECCR